jgi:plastocyanin
MQRRRFLTSVIAGIACGARTLGARTAETPPRAGNLRGRVEQPMVTAHDEHRPSVGELGQPARAPIDRSRAVVYIDAAPRQAFDALPAGRVRLDQRNQTFVPHLIAITVGTTVDFPNDDPMFHNVMSLARGNAFDLGRYPRGRSKSVRFDTPGIVPVVCDIHAHMSAYILVFSHPFFAVTEADGGYSIPNIPAGSYTLKVWSELGSADPKRVAVADGATTEADFQVNRR